METIHLDADSREILGKAVKSLRRQGITPVNLFGAGVDSVALQCNSAELRRALASAGRTRIIGLAIDGKKKPRDVMVRSVQRAPVGGSVLHVDFFQVNMTEQVRVEVPIVLVGEAPILKSKEYMLEQEMDVLHVESLPSSIPTSAGLDVGSLSEPDQVLHVRDIQLGEGVSVLDDPEQAVARIRLRPMARTEEPAAEEAPTPSEEPGAPAEQTASSD
jgi:large subunit ribosomal protein L25